MPYGGVYALESRQVFFFQIQIWLGTLDECLSQNVVFMTSMACVIVITVSAYAVPQQATEKMALPPRINEVLTPPPAKRY